VLDSTEGTATEKVGKVVQLADVLKQSKTIKFYGNKTIERIDVYLPAEYESLIDAFRGTTNLKFMVGINTSKSTNLGNMFNVSGIEVIQEPFDFSGYSGNANYFTPFLNANALREVRIVPQTMKLSTRITSSVLSAESIQSIAYGLAYVTTAQTLTLNKVFENDFERLPAELRDLITNQKGWTLGFA
jgi:hypothetical protein